MEKTPRPEEPANLRFLRLLVTVLTGVMILGLLVIIGLFVMRFSAPAGQPVSLTLDGTLPDRIALPDGVGATGFARGGDWFAVVTDDDRILIFDAASGTLRQSVIVE